MYECVILYRLNTGSVLGITDGAGALRVFANHDEAIAFIADHQLGRLVKAEEAYNQIVELDEL